ncbi:WbqC family protein [Bizionia gelidisalsuginis]|uniref:WbqC family protein n=2 Tax=Bizionia TaxID=283785 RepID=A0A8H2LAN5_9FLAO|nr:MULTISPECIES: WbqC family protein [Bizionia]TYB70507.1 WbqC family protein [Bizionia saleffrena]TYC10655.1 WbqC family protein [Bizionia gelidisalsuginis]
MTSIILHPTYFPTIETFVALVNTDSVTFEVYDNYQKQTYRNRCYIYAANGKLQLSIPVIYTQKNRQLYQEVKIANTYNWQDIHFKSLESAYRTSPFYEFYIDDIKPLYTTPFDSILEFNMACFDVICDALQLDITITKTEDFKKEYKENTDGRDLVNAKNETALPFDNYMQVFNAKYGYINNLSILDLLFNEGPSALAYLEAQHYK